MIVPNILSVAGTDPTGGAGIQADLKSIAAHGGYGMSVVTALVAQNTIGVRGVHIPPREFFRDQLVAVSDDVRIDAIKIGMLATTDLVAELNDWLDGQPGLADVPIVLDPVMVSTSGHRLLDASAERLVRELCRRCTIVTPNIPELAILADTVPAQSWDEAREQALTLSRSAGVVVLVKGGHLDDALSPDAIVDATGSEPRIVEFVSERISTRNTHGTGCSLSSALATRLGRGEDVTSAFSVVKAWLGEAIRHSGELSVGTGNGPINHSVGSLSSQSSADRLIAHLPVRDEGHSHTEQWWSDSAIVRAETDELTFIRGLADGTLPRDQFRFYIEQDAIYLGLYSRVLQRASEHAPTEDERGFWADAAEQCLTAEMELHRSRLDGAPAAEPAATTRAYLDHLMAAADSGDYARITAAVLPCYWIYRDIGRRLSSARHADHPYDDWLASYADEGFDRATDRAIVIAEAAVAASPSSAAAAAADFYRSAELERDFFAAPALRG
ncbi:MAG: bifunctional hydroxymethylpyrimidine kinase/phosphomethylpyrimidine kinase [Mycetocola sp.]